MSEEVRERTIRSFVLRAGRMTKAQNNAYQMLWTQFGLECSSRQLDIDGVFGRKAPLILEIGFGMGDSLLSQALDEPDHNFLGVEVHKPGIGRLMNDAKKLGINNLRIICEDAVKVLADRLTQESLAGVQIYFPDPWPKTRHHKRRIIQPEFIKLLAHKVRLGGFCHLATDWTPYAEWMLDLFSQNSVWHNLSKKRGYVVRPQRRPITKFEMRGELLGHHVFDLLFEKKHQTSISKI